MAALLRGRPGACLTGPFILGLFDVDGFCPTDPFDVLLKPGRRLRGVGFPHRHNPTPKSPTASRGALVVVSITAALVDSARCLDGEDRRLRLAYDQCRWKGMTTADKVAARIRELGQRDPGASRFATLLADSGYRPESDGERAAGQALRGIDPEPESQMWVGRYRIDWYWPLYRFGIEYQGVVDHVGVQADADDAQRAADLSRSGIKILTVTSRDVAHPGTFRVWGHAQLVVRAHELKLPAPRLQA